MQIRPWLVDNENMESKCHQSILLKNDQHKNDDLMNNPDYHFRVSLLPHFSEFDSLEKLQVRARLHTVIIDALQTKKKQGNIGPQQNQQGYSVSARYALETNSQQNLQEYTVPPEHYSGTQACGLQNIHYQL
ncbi:uncharacterized protein LOC130896747 [Diorhabda carinulata]|uniref:uncharacterized protein LOC130896747 n=1 Tax=Diorhabda carinulata TaxID=1163345 RepID=UPI0025A01B06|nr:uncharacterized protein LOC130896747 [Diorhabda carinulata]